MMGATERRGVAEMTAAMLISGTIGAFVILSGEPVLQVVFWRCLIGAGTLLAICGAMGLLRRDVITRRQLVIAILGGIAIVTNWLLLFASFRHASISIATAIYNTQPFMLVGLGALFLRERPGIPKLLWLGLAFGGVVLIAQAKQAAATAPDGDYLFGVALALGAAFFYALAAFAAKALQGVAPHLIALIHVCVGIVMLAPLAAISGLPSGAMAWGTLGAMGVLHTGLMYILLYGAIQKLPTATTGALSFLYPATAFAVDFLFFGQRLGLLQAVGIAAILLGAAGMTLGWSPWRLPERRRA